MDRRHNTSLSDLDHGKLQPQAVDLEEAIIGALLLEKEAIHVTMEILSADSFYKESHHKIYSVITSLSNDSKPVDILTVTNELKKRGELEIVGGPYYITQLTNRVASASNVEEHARIVLQMFIKREVIRECSDRIKEAYDETSDALDCASKLAGSASDILMLTENKEIASTGDIVRKIVKDVHDAKHSKELTGVPTPFKKINERMGGWQDSDLVIVAARPSMGKTAYAIQLATHPVYFHNKRAIVFSLEMSAQQLVARILGQETDIPVNRFTRDAKYMDLDELNTKMGENDFLYSDNIIIDDKSADVNQLIARSKSINLKKKVSLIVVDYLQLLSDSSVKSSKGNREQEVSSISRKLKLLAKDINVPVIALSQLSRGVESRGGDRRPMLSDLRESGAIEQNADIVQFINRPEYYGLTEDENGNSTLGIASIITAKYRNGAIGDDILKWEAKYTRFKDYVDESQLQEPIPVTKLSRLPHNEKFDDEKDDYSLF